MSRALDFDVSKVLGLDNISHIINPTNEFSFCSLKVAKCLRLGPKHFIGTEQIVKTYDNSRREVIRIVTIDVTIGPI